MPRISRNQQKRRARKIERQMRANAIERVNEGRPLHRLVRVPKRNLGMPIIDMLAERRLRQRSASRLGHA
jgi:hypothetical protein